MNRNSLKSIIASLSKCSYVVIVTFNKSIHCSFRLTARNCLFWIITVFWASSFRNYVFVLVQSHSVSSAMSRCPVISLLLQAPLIPRHWGCVPVRGRVEVFSRIGGLKAEALVIAGAARQHQVKTLAVLSLQLNAQLLCICIYKDTQSSKCEAKQSNQNDTRN